MKKLIIILIMALSVSTFAQTGIGTTTPNASAQLDVSSTTKGFLPPRVALTSTTSASPLAAHVAGMVVYNTATAGDVTPGLYVNTGTVWEKQVGATNINGLIDAKTDAESIFLGGGAGFQDNGLNSNTGVGINTLYSVTSGADNVGIGYQASPHTQTTSNNTVIGSNANKLNFGSDNVSVGSYAGYQTNGSGNVLLGNHAGYFSSSSVLNNKLYIENSASATPLIYGEFDTNLARINGNFEVTGTVKIEGSAPGLGKILTSDANGLASWETPAAATTLTGLTSTVAELNKLDGFTGTVTDFNYAKDLRATGVTNTEFDYLDGVTSNIQTQLNGKLSTTGNAATATKLLTARTINGVSFNGTASITVDPYIEADNATNANRHLAFSDTSTSAYKRLSTDANLYYNPSANRLYSSYFQGSLSGNATTATTATYANYAYVERDDSTNAWRYLTFVDSYTAGNKRVNMDTNLKYNPSNNYLYTNISGTLSGNASTATTATTATNASYVYMNNADNDTNNPILFTTNTTAGNKRIYEDSALYFDSTNNRLHSSWFFGSLSGNASTATKLQTARTIYLTGDVTGSVSFNGGSNVSLNAVVGNNTHTHSYLPLTGGTLTGGLKITGTTYTAIADYYYRKRSGNGDVNSATNKYLSLYATGDIAAPEFNAYSDKRIKTDIKPIVNSLEIIKKLQPSSYTKIDKVRNGSGIQYGFIAQELEEVIPQAVSKNEGEIPLLKNFDEVDFEDGVEYTIAVKHNDGTVTQEDYNSTLPRPDGDLIVLYKKVNDFRTVDYNMVFTHAVAAIQEQQQEIQTLQKRMQEQQVMIDELKKIVSTLVKK